MINNRCAGQSLPELSPLSKDAQNQLVHILDEYLVSLEQGEPIPPQDVLEKHPEYAPYLRQYLSGLNLFHQGAIGQSSLDTAPSPASGVRQSPGQRIGDFELVREIGRGGMGVVYEARQLSLRRRVALKVLPFSSAHQQKQIARFKNEAQAAAQVRHPNIVPVYAVGEDNGVHFYAMQLIDGQSLTEILAQLNPEAPAKSVGTTVAFSAHSTSHRQVREVADAEACDAPTAASERIGKRSATFTCGGAGDHARAVARLGVQAAEALHAAHEYGVVHRDVKPSNLMVDDDGKLWVTDFGLARCRDGAALTQTGDVVGTMRYMSPEQALGRGELIDHRTDVYSLGVTLYELASLHHPAGDASDAAFLFGKERRPCIPMRHWNRHIPVDFETIVMKAISEFPAERYASAQEFANDLTRYLEGKPILASPPSIVSRVRKWAGRHRGAVYAAASMLLLAFVGQSYNAALLAEKNAEKEQALAESRENLREAHSVLDRVASLDDQLVAIPGAEGVRSQLLNDSLDHYRSVAAKAEGDPLLDADLARAYSRLGALNEKLGRMDESLARHRASRAVWAQRVKQNPSQLEANRNLALCDNNIGHLLAEKGDRRAALVSYRTALKRQERLSSAHPEADDVRADLATTHNNLGLELRTSDRDSAEKSFRKAIAIQEQLVRTSPSSELALRGLAASYNNLGALATGIDGEEAREFYKKAVQLQLALGRANPVNRIYQGDLARTYNNLGYAASRQGEWDEAEICYNDAVQIQRNLVRFSPLAAQYRRDLAISYNNLGMAQFRTGNVNKAETAFREAIQLQQWLLEAAPADAKLLSDVGGVCNNLGVLLEQRDRCAEAEAAFSHAVDYQRRAVESAPEIDRYFELLKNHYVNYESCLRSQAKFRDADSISREATTLADTLGLH